MGLGSAVASAAAGGALANRTARAGIGENRAELRAAICADLDQLGIVLDAETNNSTRATEAVISVPNSRVKVMVIPTNEELVVAREAKRFLENAKN